MSGKLNTEGWLNLGWLADKQLVLRVKAHKARLEEKAGCHIPMSQVVRALLKTALMIEEAKFHDP